MSRSEAQQRGVDFEEEAATVLGLRQTSNSGAGTDKSDAKGALRLSCKSSTDPVSWTEVKRYVLEAVDMAYGTGETPALALEDDAGAQFLILRLQDAGEFLTLAGEVVRPRTVKRAERIAANAEIPALLRGLEDS